MTDPTSSGAGACARSRRRPRATDAFAIALCAVGAALAPSFGSAAEALKSYNVDPRETSVSGLSSGGYMAVQMHVAFSATLRGAGIFAGGPYACTQGSLTTALTTCMQGQPAPNVQTYVNSTTSRFQARRIDDPANLNRQRVYMFSGTRDATVVPAVMQSLYDYYLRYLPASSIQFKKDLVAAHTFPTTNYGNACSTAADPFISDCDYDGAGIALTQIYGPLNARNNGTPTGTFIEFNQTEFLSNPAAASMANTGWAYVPASCARGDACRLHIAFHGCKQYYGLIGDKYVRRTGFNEWADSNNMIVLYPQTIASQSNPQNPNGCWDWWGYTGSNFDLKDGVQMAAVKKMLDRVAAGYVALPAPANLSAQATGNNSIALSWSAVSGASGYNVYRNGTRINSALLVVTGTTDNGLTAGTSYSYVVRAVSGSGAESASSNTATATTTGTAPALPAPGNLRVSAKTDSSVSLAWDAVSGVAGYNVYRGTSSGGPYARDNTALVAGASYVDGGLNADTQYYWVARSVDASGRESAASNEVTARTGVAATCYRTSNWTHYTAGRATNCGGYACAVGSGQNMGLLNLYVVTTLKQTGVNYYVIGTCS